MSWRKQLTNCVCGLRARAQLKTLSSLLKARFKGQTFQVPNPMQMSKNNQFFSFALDSTHENFDVWTGPKSFNLERWWLRNVPVRSTWNCILIWGFHVTSSPPCWSTETKDLFLPPFVQPPEVVHFSVAVGVSGSWFKASYSWISVVNLRQFHLNRKGFSAQKIGYAILWRNKWRYAWIAIFCFFADGFLTFVDSV